MKNFRSFLFLLLLTILGLAGCKSLKPGVLPALKKTPDSYSVSGDSASSAQISWREFFNDKKLVSLIDTALKNNLDLLGTLQSIEASRANFQANKGSMLPTVGINLAYLQRKFGYYTMDDAGNRTTLILPDKIIPTHLPDFYTGFQSSWEIDLWGKLRNRKRAAALRLMSSIEGKNLAVTNLVAEIASNYYELISLDNELSIIRESIRVQEEALSVIKVQKQAGFANELAVKQFEAQVLNSKALELTAQQSIIETEARLNLLLGRYPQKIERDTAAFSNNIPPIVNAGIPSDLLVNRPDIRIAEYELLASKADLKAARAAFFPTLNLSGSVGFQGFNLSYLFMPQSLAYNLLGGITAPLVNRSAIKAAFKSANANQINAFYNYQKSIISGYVEVNNEVANLRTLEDIHKLKLDESAAITSAVEISLDLYKTGRASYFEVLMAQTSSLQTKIELLQTRKIQFISTINLYKALGGGWK